MPAPTQADMDWMQQQIEGGRAAGETNEQLEAKIMARPELAAIYRWMPPIVPRTPIQTAGHWAQLGAEQFIRGAPSLLALPGNLNVLANQLTKGIVPVSPHLITSADIDRWATGAERSLGIEPAVPQTPLERVYAGTMEGIGAGVAGLGTGTALNLATRGVGAVASGIGVAPGVVRTMGTIAAPTAAEATGAAAAGGGSGLAAEIIREYAPGLGPVAPLVAGALAGGVLQPGVAAGQRYLTRPPSYGDIRGQYNAIPEMWPTPNVVPPGQSRTDVGNALKAGLAHETSSPTAPPGARGVPNSDLSQQQIDDFVNTKAGDKALDKVQRNPQLAADLRNNPALAPVMDQGGRAILSMNPEIHIPNAQRYGTLESFFPNAEHRSAILDQYGKGRPSAPTLSQQQAAEHAQLMRLLWAGHLGGAGSAIGGFAQGALGVGGAVAGHFDPGLAAAMASLGATIPYMGRIYNWIPPGTVPGITTGTAIGANQPRRVDTLTMVPMPGT